MGTSMVIIQCSYVGLQGTLGAFLHNNDSSSEASILLPFPRTPSSTTPPPRTCYICYNCKTFEPASQARQCDGPDEQFCWKEELETGEVNRLCATQEKCDSATSSSLSTCCSGDRCNTSSTYSSLPDMAWVVVMAVVRQTLLVT